MTHECYDVTVIGGGPVGMYATFYCGMRELKTKLIERNPYLGGKVAMFYPEKTIRDLGGIPAISGAELIRELDRQANTFAPTIVSGQLITMLERLQDGTFRLHSSDGHEHLTRAILLTVGSGIFHPVKLEVPGAERFEGQNLHYQIDSLDRFAGRHVLISGGGNAAIDWAVELLPVARSVTMVHRRHEFTGHESQVALVRERAQVMTPYVIQSLHGREKIEAVTLAHAETGERRTLKIDELIVNHGIAADYGGLLSWGLEMADGRFVVNQAMATNIPGIFAAGDAVIYPHKVHLIATGFTEGMIAVNSVKQYLEPEQQLQAIYSTHHEKLLASR